MTKKYRFIPETTDASLVARVIIDGEGGVNLIINDNAIINICEIGLITFYPEFIEGESESLKIKNTILEQGCW